MEIQYVGHSTLRIETDMKIIIDPYLKGKGREGLSRFNPNAALSVKDVERIGVDLIVLTHGHGDHFGQTLELLERTKARLIASEKVCSFVSRRQDRERLLSIEPNEKLRINQLKISALKARHRYGLEGVGGDILGWLAYERYIPCGTNMGYLMSIEGKKIYHSGDTHVIADVYRPDIAFLAMDGFRTLNDKEAIDAIREIRPKIVVPIHYRVFRGGREIAKKVMRTVENEEKATEFRELTYGETMEI
jgi:L-ascorbate metabolism protein UlaG (beta-lactamase superfamily)